MSGALIRLSEHDGVVVCCRAVKAAEVLVVDRASMTVGQDVQLGHKLALDALSVGDKVVKYGMPIGSMTAAAAPGEWVHLHNIKSDYLPAHLRDAVGADARTGSAGSAPMGARHPRCDTRRISGRMRTPCCAANGVSGSTQGVSLGCRGGRCGEIAPPFFRVKGASDTK